MPKLEYRVCAVRGDTPVQIEQELNSNLRDLSEEGWRFVETIYGHNSLPLLLFKKQTKLSVKFGGEKTAGVSQGKGSKQK
jgi:hypothetical protein